MTRARCFMNNYECFVYFTATEYSSIPTESALNFESIWPKITTVRVISQGKIDLMDQHGGYFWWNRLKIKRALRGDTTVNCPKQSPWIAFSEIMYGRLYRLYLVIMEVASTNCLVIFLFIINDLYMVAQVVHEEIHFRPIFQIRFFFRTFRTGPPRGSW